MTHGLAGAEQGREIGFVVGVHRRWHRDDIDALIVEHIWIGADSEPAQRRQVGRQHFAGSIVAPMQGGDAPGIDIETGHAAPGIFGQRHGQREPDIAQTNNGDPIALGQR